MGISRESIFTGLNNLSVLTIADANFDEYFGFTDPEVRALLAGYGMSEKYDVIKEWYDGYRFGNVDVYCPWDVICCCRKFRTEPDGRLDAACRVRRTVITFPSTLKQHIDFSGMAAYDVT